MNASAIIAIVYLTTIASEILWLKLMDRHIAKQMLKAGCPAENLGSFSKGLAMSYKNLKFWQKAVVVLEVSIGAPIVSPILYWTYVQARRM